MVTVNERLRNVSGLLAVILISTSAAWFLRSTRPTDLFFPDSEYYFSLGTYGAEITSRAPQDVYYWTKLGIILPRLLINRFFDPLESYDIYVLVLTAMAAIGFYLFFKSWASASVSLIATLIVLSNTTIWSLLGDPYSIGASIVLLIWVLLFSQKYWNSQEQIKSGYVSHLCALGVLAGIQIMVNLIVGLLVFSSIIVLLFIKNWLDSPKSEEKSAGGNARQFFIDAVVFSVSTLIMFWLIERVGNLVFGGLGWIETTLKWIDVVDPSSFSSALSNWLPWETPLIFLIVVASTSSFLYIKFNFEHRWYTLWMAFGFLLPTVFAAMLLGLNTLEKPYYNAFLWPPVLGALMLVFLTYFVKEAVGKRTNTSFAMISLLVMLAVSVVAGFSRFPFPLIAVLVLVVFGTVILMTFVWSTAHWSQQRSRFLLVALMIWATSGLQLAQNGAISSGSTVWEFGGDLRMYTYAGAFTGEIDRGGRARDLLRFDADSSSWILDQVPKDSVLIVDFEPGSPLASGSGMFLVGFNSLKDWEGVLHLETFSHHRPDFVAIYSGSYSYVKQTYEEMSKYADVAINGCRIFSDYFIDASWERNSSLTLPAYVCLLSVDWKVPK